MKKIFISGAGGMLGDAFYREFRDDYKLRCTDRNSNEAWLLYCDITELRMYYRQVEKFKPDYLFHLGAITNLEYCEANRFEALLANQWAVSYAVFISEELEVPLLYIGTAGVFDGMQVAYDEQDIPNPMGVYAQTKYKGEVLAQENPYESLVCRASWMVGGGWKKDKMFVMTILNQIKSGKKAIKIVNDKKGTMTYTRDFVKNVRLLIEEKQTGLFNVANTGNTSRLEIANEVVSILGLENEIEIKGVPSSYFSKSHSAPRPDCECLINKRLDKLGLNIMRPWKVALREYLESLFTGDIRC